MKKYEKNSVIINYHGIIKYSLKHAIINVLMCFFQIENYYSFLREHSREESVQKERSVLLYIIIIFSLTCKSYLTNKVCMKMKKVCLMMMMMMIHWNYIVMQWKMEEEAIAAVVLVRRCIVMLVSLTLVK